MKGGWVGLYGTLPGGQVNPVWGTGNPWVGVIRRDGWSERMTKGAIHVSGVCGTDRRPIIHQAKVW